MIPLLLTGYNEKFAPLAAITVPRLKEYAGRHGMAFVCNEYVESSNPYWQKIRDTISTLPWYGHVLWLDADQLVTNFDLAPPRFESGVHFSRDWGVDATEPSHLSTCGFVACRDALPIFDWAEAHRESYINGPFFDQQPMRDAMAQNLFPGLMHVHERRILNAVPIEVHESAPEPWQPGDFCAHLTNLPVAGRVALAKKILERI